MGTWTYHITWEGCLPIGKYKKKPIRWLQNNDPDYLVWFSQQSRHKRYTFEDGLIEAFEETVEKNFRKAEEE